MPGERPYKSLTDDELEARWNVLQEMMQIVPGLSIELRREIAILSADLSHERCVRLTKELWPLPTEDTPDEPYYDDRYHQMKRS